MITSQKIIEKIQNFITNNDSETFYEKGVMEIFEQDDMISEINNLMPEQAFQLLLKVKNHNDACRFFVEYVSEFLLDDKFYSEESDIYERLFSNNDVEHNVINIELGQEFLDKFSKPFESVSEDDIKKIKLKLNNNISNWIENDIQNLDIYEFNILINWIYKKRLKKT